MHLRIFVYGSFLVSTLAFAQTSPDFSGVYLSSPVKRQPPIPGAVEPVVLEVKQSADSFDVTTAQNGVSAATHYRFGAVPSRGVNGRRVPQLAGVRLKDEKLLIEYQVERPSSVLEPGPRKVKETWELSQDRQTLTVTRKYEFASSPSDHFTEVATYSRQISLNAALAVADAASNMSKCNSFMPPSTQEKNVKYDVGARLGTTSFRQLDRYVLFSADLSGQLFDGLERIRQADGFEFLKNRQVVSKYSDFVILEIEPQVFHLSPWVERVLLGTISQLPNTVLPDEFLNLRFKLKWIGSAVRELGEVEAELLTEPWTELRPPSKFYRLQVAAKDVPLTDNLEIRILTAGGKQIGCISGHI